ncbi:actophorin-like isoform X2 [Mya arenaria]|uniref:actophorin-like isoform X2 n=1 Tax=Mya arenaria TaxID=6604 RepID=UPI0022DFF7FB|nr:actophorin-like isoform X2 [Mya arenaria]
MASGISVDDECAAAWVALQAGHKHSYVIFKISDDKKKIEVDCKGEPGEPYQSLREKLKQKGACRYAVMDFEYDPVKKAKKTVFIAWVPDDCSIKEKMLYASSKQAMKDKLTGFGKEIQANDDDELDEKHLMEKCCSKYD